MLLKALSHAEYERSSLNEKLTSVQRELSAAVAEHGRQKREMIARQEQQSQYIDALQLELKNVQEHLEHAKYNGLLVWLLFISNQIKSNLRNNKGLEKPLTSC